MKIDHGCGKGFLFVRQIFTLTSGLTGSFSIANRTSSGANAAAFSSSSVALRPTSAVSSVG